MKAANEQYAYLGKDAEPLWMELKGDEKRKECFLAQQELCKLRPILSPSHARGCLLLEGKMLFLALAAQGELPTGPLLLPLLSRTPQRGGTKQQSPAWLAFPCPAGSDGHTTGRRKWLGSTR